MNRLFVQLIFAAVLLLPSVSAEGEGTPRILRFEPAVIDIDSVRYDAGEIKVRFECVNISDKAVVIMDVRSQCGCLKPSFSSKSIAPGEKSYVDAVLDPKGLFADQKRHLTVIATNGDYRKFNTLTLTGYVDRGISETEIRYPYLLCPGLRSDIETLGMRLSEKGEVSVREFTVYNESSSPMSLDWTSDDRCVDAYVPEIIEAGSTARVKVSVKTGRIPSGTYEKKLILIVNGVLKSEPLLLKGAVK